MKKVPDEKTLTTKLESMDNCLTLIWIIIISVFIIFAAMASFIPKNTLYLSKSDVSSAIPKFTVSNSAHFRNFTPMNSFAILSIRPYLSKDVKSLPIKFSGTSRIYNKALQQISVKDINITKNINCKKGVCDDIDVLTYNFVNFESVSLTGDLTSVHEVLRKFDIYVTSIDSNISYTFIIIIAIITTCLAAVLFIVGPRRLYPTRPDHWGVLILAIFAVCIDGPWLLLKLFATPAFSHLYDVLPEIFHIVFVMFIMAFYNGLTNGWANRIFGSWVISIIIAVGLLTSIVLQAISAAYAPLNVLSIYLSSSLLQIPIYIITIAMHLIIVAICVLGLICIQITSNFTLVLIGIVSFVLELLDTIRILLRFFSAKSHVGFSFAADVFYILVANMIAAFFLFNNLPVDLSIKTGENLEDAMVPDSSPKSQDDDDDELPEIP